MKNMSFEDTVIRGLSAIVKELQSIHGEATLMRQTAEKFCEVQKQISEKISKIENHAFVSNQMISELKGSAEKTANSAFITQCELNRIILQKEKAADDGV